MVQFDPIGTVCAEQKYKYQQPRQGEFAQNSGTIELISGRNFEQALEDLQGFSHIWVIYQFHHNEHWKPKVNVPISPDGKKKGVFATRSPYRPNPIGLSCVKLTKISGLTLHIENFDLLDGTPVLDIKPYISQYDSQPEASSGWLLEELPSVFDCVWNESASTQANWLIAHNGPDLFDLVQVQLSIDPLNRLRKRISLEPDGSAVLAFRTWRIGYRVDGQTVLVDRIWSGYSLADLVEGAEDRWEDKPVHRLFVKEFEIV